MKIQRKVGRPAKRPDKKRQKITLTLPPEIVTALFAKADNEGVSASSIIEAAMKTQLSLEETRASATAFPVASPPPVAPTPKEYWLDLYGGVAAGAQISSDATQEPVRVSRPYPDDCYLLRVFGRSMEPKILDGSLIVVKRWGQGFPKKGTVVVYSDGNGSTLKEFGYRKAKPDEDADSMGNVPVLRSINKAFADVATMDGGRIEAVFVESL